jgi:hypothetical protein
MPFVGDIRMEAGYADTVTPDTAIYDKSGPSRGNPQLWWPSRQPKLDRKGKSSRAISVSLIALSVNMLLSKPRKRTAACQLLRAAHTPARSLS